MKFICYIIIMWFLNYCSPFLFNDTDTINTYRTLMYSEILGVFCIYIVFITIYKIAGETRMERETFRNQPKQTLREMIAFKFVKGDYWMSQKDFKEWFMNYFSLHAVSVGICIMYSPYIVQVVFIGIHFVTFLICTILVHFRKTGCVKYLFYTLMIISNFLNVSLLFSGIMGVGASGFDSTQKVCLRQVEFD